MTARVLPEPEPETRPTSGPVPVPAETRAALVEKARTRWRAALVAQAGESALADIERLEGALVDLTKAHPNGVAQLFAGRATPLSNLVREGSALASAKRNLRLVATRAEDHANRFGSPSAYLAIGVATWTEEVADDEADAPAPVGPLGDGSAAEGSAAEGSAAGRAPNGAADGAAGSPPEDVDDTDTEPMLGTVTLITGQPQGEESKDAGREPTKAPSSGRTRTVRAPVLLRPVTIRPRRGETDHDLALEPSAEVNPVLAGALRSRGALVDPAALAQATFTPTGFDPRPAMERIRGLGDTLLSDFSLTERLLVGTFVHPEQSLVTDLDALATVMAEHEVIAALAGDQRAVSALAHPLPPPLTGDRPPEEERGVGDLDPAQVHVLDALGAGHHLVVDAPPGSDVAGTVAAVVADAVAGGRTVLYLAGHRRSAEALLERLNALGLGESVLDVAPGPWREQAAQRLLGAMTLEPVEVEGDKVEIVERELANRRSRLQRYLAALHLVRQPWGVSAYDALQALARLTAGRPVPQTRVRLATEVAHRLDVERRRQVAADLERAARLGAFSAATRASAWFGADLASPELARRALALVDRMLAAVPRLRADAERVVEETGVDLAVGVASWGEQIRMLDGIRDSLDVFRPVVFERSAADLITATATRAWREQHGLTMRRSMRRRLRKQAKDLVRPGRPVADLHAALIDVQAQQEVWRSHCPAGGWPMIPRGLSDLDAGYRQVRADLDSLSELLGDGVSLAELTWSDLETRLHRLRKDRASLETLPERAEVVERLTAHGLGPLLADLVARHVPTEVVAAELELAWWSTVFDQILRQDPVITSHDGGVLTRLVAEFRVLDQRFLADRAVLARAAAREAVQARMRAAESETEELFGELVEGRFASLATAVQRYPAVARYLRPAVVAAPMQVPHLLPPSRTQDLVILDAAANLPLEVVLPAVARGGQLLVVGDIRCGAGSALAALAEVLPVLPLLADGARRDPRLTAFLAQHGYGDRLINRPLPQANDLLRLEVVPGSGMPGDGGAVEATGEEVDRVVDLITEHALNRPQESLAVVTPSALHADRVRDALHALIPASAALEAFCEQGPEPFTIVELGSAQGLSRDAVIFSVGFGRTPHGRVLHRFGSLTEPGGDARLLAALGSARHRLTVVSCFAADQLDRDRLRAPGAILLHDLLRLAAQAPQPTGRGAPTATDPDRLLLDLAERLWRMGLLVDVDHGVEGGERIPLVVGHPDLPEEMLVAVLTDDAGYLAEPSIRIRDRQLPQRLEKLGWAVVQVWSSAVFLDPQAEAQAICAVVVEERARRLAKRG